MNKKAIELKLKDALNVRPAAKKCYPCGVCDSKNWLINEALAELQAEPSEPENTVANLLCYILDNHELAPLSEETLQGIGAKFLESKYNKRR